MKSIVTELKFRLFYTLLTLCSLFGIVYFDFGYQLEYLWSYFFTHYQTIDFCWKESLAFDLSNLEPTGPFEPKQTNPVILSSKTMEHNWGAQDQLFAYESQEWGPLFLSSLFFFNDHIKLDQVASFNAFPLMFYFIVTLIIYHMHGFFASGLLKRDRLFLFAFYQMSLMGLFFHQFLSFPMIQIIEELSVENIDSELFTQGNQGCDFIDLWLTAHYSHTIFWFSMIIFYVVRLIRQNAESLASTEIPDDHKANKTLR